MSKLGISTGSVPNDGTGDSLLEGAQKINSNFTEIYDTFGDGVDLKQKWIRGDVGIHTLDTVGFGITNPNSNTTLQVGTAISMYGSTGIISATTYYGDGSKLSNLSVSSLDELNVSGFSTFSSNVDINSSVDVSGDLVVDGLSDLDDVTITGVSTFSSNVDINSSVDVSGHTELATLKVTGLSTFSNPAFTGTVTLPTVNIDGDLTFTGSNDIYFGDGGIANFGATNDLQIYHSGSASFVMDSGTGGLTLGSDNEVSIVKNGAGGDILAKFTPDGSTEFYYDNNKKFETLGTGVTITGTTFSNELVISGISTFEDDVNIGTAITFYASTGIVSATTFVGNFSGSGSGLTNIPAGQLTGALPAIDGSALTGVVGSGSGVIIEDDATPVGTAGTINFGTGLSVSPISAGIVTVTATGSGESYWTQTASGIHTLSNVGVGTTNPTSSLTVSGDILVTGITTHQNSISVRPSATGNEFVSISPYGRMILGSSIGTAAGIDIINNTTSSSAEIFTISTPNVNLYNKKIVVDYGGRLLLGGNLNASLNNAFTVLDNSGNINLTGYVSAGGTIGASGATVTGNTSLETLSVSGISTFEDDVNIGTGITFYASTGNVNVGSAITFYASTGIVSATTFYGDLIGSITDATNLTGGYAQASSLNVSGITTISQGRIQANADANLRFGNLPTGSGSVRNIAIGDQVLNSLSGGSGRNIGIGELSYYNTTSGQYNIGLGVQAGQNITTGSYNVIIGGYNGQSGLDIRTSSNNVVIADGEGNIRQYIDSSGNIGIKTTVITEALTVAGIVSATSFYGTLNAGQLTGALPAIDGSALTGVVGSGSGVIIEDDATPVGTAGTINFGSNLNVSFASGIATVSGASSVSEATTAYGIAGSPDVSLGNVNAGIATFSNNVKIGLSTAIIVESGNIQLGTNATGTIIKNNEINLTGPNPTDLNSTFYSNIRLNEFGSFGYHLEFHSNGYSSGDIGDFIFYRRQTSFGRAERFRISGETGTITATGGGNFTGVVTASSFSGSGSGLTNIPSGQLTGALPAIDGSALLNVTASGTGVVIEDDQINVGSATTIDFGTGLDVAFSSGIATITASGGSLQSRTIVSGSTTSIVNNGIGNTDITGFKSYALMKVGLSTTGWLRIYTDSASRDADVSRSIGEDPLPGSGVIAEVVTTGISTTQIISPFVNGGNLDEPATTTIYASIKNLSGSTQAITANLTILQLEA